MPPNLPRCVYSDGRGRCRRRGIGSPAFCRKHYEAVVHGPGEDDLDFDLDDISDYPLNSLEDLLRHPMASLLGAALRDRVLREIGRRASPPPPPPGRGFYSQSPPPPPGAGPHQQRRPPRSQPSPPPRPAPEDPRTILGFPPGSMPSTSEISRKRKQLAAIYHPDVGGNDEAMRRINAAADQLLAEVG